MLTKECKGCLQGCAECELFNAAKCVKCEKGQALLKDMCRPECPSTHKKSADGSVCEKRDYPFDHNFIPFPFMGTFATLFAII